MAFLKLKKSQSIIDNLKKIQSGDLVFVRIPKTNDCFINKSFVVGAALRPIEVLNQKGSKPNSVFALYLLVDEQICGVKFIFDTIFVSRKISGKVQFGKKKKASAVYVDNYESFMNHVMKWKKKNSPPPKGIENA